MHKVSQFLQYCSITTGTSTAYVAPLPIGVTLAEGLRAMVMFHAACGASPTLNLGGLGVKDLYKPSATGPAFVKLSANDILANHPAEVFYQASLPGYVVLSQLVPAAAGGGGGGAAGYAGISMEVTSPPQNIPSQTLTDILWDARIAATADITHTNGQADATIVSAGKWKLSGVIHLNLTGNTTGWGTYRYEVYADAVVISRGLTWGYKDVTSQIVSPLVIQDSVSLTAGQVIKVSIRGDTNSNTFDVIGLTGGLGSTNLYLEYQGA